MTPESRRIILIEWVKAKSQFNQSQEHWKVAKNRLDQQSKDLMALQAHISGLEIDLNPTVDEIDMSEPWRENTHSRSDG